MKKVYGIVTTVATKTKTVAVMSTTLSVLVAGCAQAVSTGMESKFDASKSVESAAKPTPALPGAVSPARMEAIAQVQAEANAPAKPELVTSQKMTTADGAKLVEDYFSGWQTMTADFSQTTDGEAFVQEGTFTAKRPQQFLWRYETPMRQKIVGTGTAIYYVDEETNTVTQLPSNAGMTRLFTGGKLDLAKEGMGVTFVESSPLQVAVTLTFDPKVAKESGGLKTVRMTFSRNQAGGATELRRVEATDAAGVVTMLNLSNVKRDVTVDAKLFRYTPPQMKR